MVCSMAQSPLSSIKFGLGHEAVSQDVGKIIFRASINFTIKQFKAGEWSVQTCCVLVTIYVFANVGKKTEIAMGAFAI